MSKDKKFLFISRLPKTSGRHNSYETLSEATLSDYMALYDAEDIVVCQQLPLSVRKSYNMSQIVVNHRYSVNVFFFVCPVEEVIIQKQDKSKKTDKNSSKHNISRKKHVRKSNSSLAKKWYEIVKIGFKNL